MLKGISPLLSPDLLKTLMEMGHGDEIALLDGNFPAQKFSKRVIRADGLKIPYLLEAILELFPLDTFVDSPITMLTMLEGETNEPNIWEKYLQMIEKKYVESIEKSGYINQKITHVDRYAFYERTQNAYVVVATGETSIYANIILKKGVVFQKSHME